MQAMKRYRSMMMGVVMLGFGGISMIGACGADVPSGSQCPSPSVDPPIEQPIDCATPVEKPCMRYRIQLDGDVMDPVVRAKYIAKFGSACYVSEANTFDCFYKDPQKACDDGVLVPEVIGATPHDKGYPCLKVAGTENYWRQTGSDPAIKIDITFAEAPRQTPLIEVNGTPTAVDGPCRNLTEPQKLGPGEDFYCSSGMVDENGKALNQKDWILLVNRKAYGGEIHSDLAGFTYPCGEDENCKPKICTEPLILKKPPVNDPEEAQVHHIVPRRDKRSCPWGTNSNKNAAVISRRLNQFLFNKVPPENEVLQINKVLAYTP